MRDSAVRLLLLTLFAVVLSGCGKSLVTSRIEKGIEARLPQLIGPAKSYEVDVAGRTARMIRGEMAEIRIHGREVSVTPTLTVDDLEVRLRNVVFDKDSQTIKSCSSTEFIGVVKEATLNTYLRAARPDLDDLSVRLKKEKMLVHVRPSVLKLSFGVDLEGGLRIEKPAKVCFAVDQMSLAGVSMPGKIASLVESRINPLQDLTETGLKVELTSVELSPGAMTMKGTADILAGLSAR